jgi:hypothetical protein
VQTLVHGVRDCPRIEREGQMLALIGLSVDGLVSAVDVCNAFTRDEDMINAISRTFLCAGL